MKFTFVNVMFVVVLITFLFLLSLMINTFTSNAKYLLYVFGGLAFVALLLDKNRLTLIFMGLFGAVIIYIINAS